LGGKPFFQSFAIGWDCSLTSNVGGYARSLAKYAVGCAILLFFESHSVFFWITSED
jgi:hypothetical protein